MSEGIRPSRMKVYRILTPEAPTCPASSYYLLYKKHIFNVTRLSSLYFKGYLLSLV